MTHIEQLHLEAIDSEVYIAYRLYEDRVVGTDEAATKSAEITEQIACDFMDWYWDVFVFYDVKNKLHNIRQIDGIQELTTKQLFQEYPKSKENDK